MSENVLNLPADLKERREVLENELKETVTKLISSQLNSSLRELFLEYGLSGEEAILTWEFHPESDDEGGTDWHPSYFNLDVDGESVEMGELTVNKKSKWSDTFYDYTLDEEMHEFIYDWKEDLYNNGVKKLIIRMSE